ncbi:MAG: 3-hydroxybutyryl-CoA dehydrogenase [Acidimicrobiaceae bacterium]|jgi:3-hydroxybutyryl-CoA dehydrogenase|nr:3-hydroxybutyryl-CoA dehydrogenase [Acidimicrobiaceae bacterium]MBT5581591.1 3-hydroxybutyryl-CoA dehydrogenase [Acidimicrobiaceae bacterium]MBT5849316.1 3-hydroxybutyryl-CoA dehydrogenase [Acidimicrobiaceae bacterium]
MAIETLGVVGAGAMGTGIIEVAAKAGVTVVARDISPEAVEAGQGRVESSMAKAVERGKLDEAARDAAIAKITWTTDLADLAACDLVIEAAPEILELKKEIFAELDGILGPDAIIATNTSSYPIIEVAMSTRRPEQVVGMHFFNPATVMKLVEVISTQRTAEATKDGAAAFAADVLGKRVVHCKDRAGFVVNMLLVPYLCQAMRMYEAGHASAEDIDEAMKLGAGHPMGPLTLSDMIGLDVMLWTAESLYDEYNEAFYAPPPLLRRMVTAGHLGRKTGQGFYTY